MFEEQAQRGEEFWAAPQPKTLPIRPELLELLHLDVKGRLDVVVARNRRKATFRDALRQALALCWLAILIGQLAQADDKLATAPSQGLETAV